MTITQAIVKVRDDIISWCTLNFKKKADTTTVNEIDANLQAHTESGVTQYLAAGPAKLNVSPSGHLIKITNSTYLHNYVSTVDASASTSIAVGYLEPTTDALTIMPDTSRQYIRIPTISKMCETESIVLTKDVQYGDTTPSDPVNGQLFFLKVEE